MNEPIACGTLRATISESLICRRFHVAAARRPVATHRRDVEPFVRLDQINRDAAPAE
jgi:hypothetical protein